MRISSITKNAGKACNNRLYRHIRTFEKIVKNYFVIYCKPYDMLFLMTDGISSACSNADIQSVIQKNTSPFAVTPLFYAASESGSQDDISAVQIKIYSKEHEEE